MENEKGWIAAKIECDLCAYVYVSVYWHECDKLECPNCGNMADFKVIEYAT